MQVTDKMVEARTTFGPKFFEDVGRDPKKWVAAIRVRLGADEASDQVLEDFFAAALAHREAEAAQVKALVWQGFSARSSLGDLYEVARLSSSVWQTLWNGTAFTGWLSGEDEAKAAAQADYDRRSALVAPPAQEPDFATSIAEVIKEESANEAACGWRSCTGCHETNEGAETGHYPFSKMFGCYVGSGCSECGGLGVVWDYWSKEALDEMQRDVATPSPAVPSGMVLVPVEPFRKLLSQWEAFQASSGNQEEAYYKLAKYAYPYWTALTAAQEGR